MSFYEKESVPEDFSLILNKNNIDKYLMILRKQIENYPIKQVFYD